MRMLDLCSGLGGASEAFLRAGWDVLRIENNPLLEDVPNTLLVNIHDWDYTEEEPFDFIWASPPCTEFSNAFEAPGPRAKRAGEIFIPNTDILNKCIEIRDYFDPKYWAIENVSGASKVFSEIIGRPVWQIIGPFFIWGNFPFIHMDYDWTHSKYDGEGWSSDPLRANLRGKVPLEVSRRLFQSVTEQRSITEWY